VEGVAAVAEASSRRQDILTDRTVRIIKDNIVFTGTRHLLTGWRDHHIIVVLMTLLKRNVHNKAGLDSWRHNEVAHQGQDVLRHA